MAEIGIFLKVVIKQEKEDRADKLTQLWMGANLQYKGLQDVLNKMGIKESPKKVTSSEVKKDWKRLAVFMSGRK